MAGDDLHPLLLRQLKRLGLAPGDAPSGWGELLQRVSRAYRDADQDRYLLERAQEVSSSEMQTLYEQLCRQRDGLEARVQERTEALRLSEARLSSLLSLSADWVWEQDSSGRFVYLSDGVKDATGLDAEELIGRRRQDLKQFRASVADVRAYEVAIRQKRAFRDFTYSICRDDGTTRYVRISGEPVFGSDGDFEGFRGVGTDVTEATLASKRVEQLARFDMLTGLPNRLVLRDALEGAIRKARRSRSGFAIGFIDLDRFKHINDSLGHAAGDELLRTMAGRLQGLMRAGDLVARFGGDEFVLLLHGQIDGERLTAVGERLLRALKEPLVLAGQSVQCSGSLGMARFPEDGGKADDLLQHADTAMYQAKQDGKNRVRLYSAALDNVVSRRFTLEIDLREAIERDQLILHFQPKYRLADGSLAGIEALARWQHPQRGPITPIDFIALAEECGLIAPLGRWVLNATCRQLRQWQDAGFVVPRCAVNVSGLQIAGDDLLDDIAQALIRYGLPAERLEVELTESVLMSDPQQSDKALKAIDAMGVRVAIDDFGTGYSSLAYLKRFPARLLKIDRSFIAGLPEDREDSAIAQAIIALGHSLGMQVLAEGVETQAQLDLLRELGCDEVQGFLTGRPVSAAALEPKLARARPDLPQADAA